VISGAALAEAKSGGNLIVGEAFAQEREDLLFARR
jgi:hypothetical protein